MNIKKALLVTLSTGLIATTLVNTNYVSADGLENSVDTEAEEKTHEPVKGESKVNIQFTAPEGAVTPLNPRNPEEELNNPGDSGQIPKGNSGALTLDYVSNIDFGNQEIKANGEDYYSTTTTPSIQVSDRRGTGGGWNVTAKVNDFENERSVKTLRGATITLTNGKKISQTQNELLNKPEVKQEIELISGGDQVDIARAMKKEATEDVTKAEGIGTWIISWLTDEESADENPNIALNIPDGGESQGSHETTINWTLSDGPSVNHDALNQAENE